MAYSLNYDRAASVLVEALFYGDVNAAKRWGLSVRTIDNYRRRLNTDADFAELFKRKKDQFETNWAEEIPAAIRNGTRFLMRAFQEADPKDPDAIHAVAGAMKMLAEIGLTKEIIDVRLGRLHREDGEESRQMDPRSLPGTTE